MASADLVLLALAGLMALSGAVARWIGSRPEPIGSWLGPLRQRNRLTTLVTRLSRLARRRRGLPGDGAARPAGPDGPEALPAPARPPAQVGPEGLDEEQVRIRAGRGEVNAFRETTSRSVGDILRANVFTRFNAMLGVLFGAILWIGPIQDALFGISILANTLIGVIQELRAKRTLDRLVVLSAPTSRVVRGGEVRELPPGQLVLDDVLELRPGDQLPVDGVVLTASGLELDESLLTGESLPVPKPPGAPVLSGSFVVAGHGRAQATRVGENAYGRRLTAEARRFALARSELRAGIDTLLAYLMWLLVPVGVFLVSRQLLHAEAGWRDAARGSIAALEGMIPQGLVLLTSLALAAGVVRLGRRQVLVQELAAVELLARVDVLCLDKTGTLTTGHIELEELVPLASSSAGPDPFTPSGLREALGALSRAEATPNPSLSAIARACPAPGGDGWRVTANVPFSSLRRWSAAATSGRGTWVLGSPDVILGGEQAAPALERVHQLSSAGRRVLALGHAPAPLAGDALPPEVTPAALVVLAEKVRSDAPEILRYFAREGVTVKVISGDDPRTVTAVARDAGIPGHEAALDGRELPAEPEALADALELHAVFGRVTPHQKQAMMEALRRRGHVVAMVGDGINDVLALKHADLGIAVHTAAPATRAVARVVLFDGFAMLPELLAEGRRVIANLERSANLFVAKTCYVVLLALAIAAAGVPFPLLPRHMTVAGTVTIGIPAFFLALPPNAARARPGFLSRVLRFAVPAGCVGTAAALAAYAVTRSLHPGALVLARTAATLTLSLCGLVLLRLLPGLGRLLQDLLLVTMAGVLAACLLLPPARAFLALELPPRDVWIAIAAAASGGGLLLALLLAGPEPAPGAARQP